MRSCLIEKNHVTAGLGAYTYNSSTWEKGEGGDHQFGLPGLHSELQVSLSYNMKLDLKSFTEGLEKWLRLRALSALPEGLTSISSIHTAAHNLMTLQFQEILMPSLAHRGTRHSCGTQTNSFKNLLSV